MEYRKEKVDIVKDEKKQHGTVDKSSSEQYFCKLDMITCAKSGAIS